MRKKAVKLSFLHKLVLSLKRVIDQSFFSGLFSQIITLLILFALILAAGNLVYNNLTINTEQLDNNETHYFQKGFIWSLIHATDPGYLGGDYIASESKLFWLGLIITLAGWFILSGFIMTIFINYYQNHLDRIQAGRIRYYFWGKQRLIFGWNQMGASIVDQLFHENRSTVIILSLTEAKSVRSDIEAFYKFHAKKSQIKNKKIFIYEGAFDSSGELQYHNFKKTEKVIILGDERINDQNVRNIQAVVKINDFSEFKKEYKRILCYVHLPDFRSYDLLQDVDLNVMERIDFRPFNFYEDWARRLWSILPETKNNKVVEPEAIYDYKPLAYKTMNAESKENVHLVVIGFGLMGQALAAQAARICHYANGEKTIISVFDANGKNAVEKFKSHFFIEAIPDIDFRFYPQNIESETGREFLGNLASDQSQITTIAVCISHSDLAMSAALSLPREILLSDIPILVWQETHSGLSELAAKLLNNQQWKDFRFFGMLTECFGLDNRLDILASRIHEDYRAKREDVSVPAWEELSEKFRWANRYQADTYSELLRSAGYRFDIYIGQDNCIEEKDIEWLAEREHDRWAAEKLIAGWKQADLKNCNTVEERKAARDNLRLIHYFLVPYGELDNIIPGTKQKDRNVINNICNLLKEPSINLMIKRNK